MKKVIIEFFNKEGDIIKRTIEADIISVTSDCLELSKKNDKNGYKTVAIFSLDSVIGAYFESDDSET